MEDFTKGNKNNFSESKYLRKYDAALSNLKGRLSAEDLSVRVLASLTANSHVTSYIFSYQAVLLVHRKGQVFVQIRLVSYVYFKSTSAPFIFDIADFSVWQIRQIETYN